MRTYSICPLTCRIVREAIELHKTREIVMHEYIEMCKEAENSYCQKCTSNEKAAMPLRDLGVE